MLCCLCESAQSHAFLSTGAQSHLIPTNPIESEGPYNLVGKILYQKEMQNEYKHYTFGNYPFLHSHFPYTAISPFLSQCFWTVYLPDARGVSVHMDLLREEELPVSFPHECQKSAHNPTVCTGCPVLFIRGTKRHRRWRKLSLCHLCSGISTVFIKEQRGKVMGGKVIFQGQGRHEMRLFSECE